MKRNILLSISFSILCIYNSYACDLCGCANGSTFFGILPQSNRAFVGLKYSIKSYDSHLQSPTFKSHEQFQNTEIWGRFYPLKNVQLMGFLPYNFNEQKLVSQNKTLKLQGLGDISFLANYSILNTLISDSTARKFDQNLSIGIGAKLPTGRYKYDLYSDIEVGNPNFQLGTGSFDALFNLIHTIRHHDMGLNTNITYKVNTQNSNNYQFGNRLMANSLFFISKKVEKATIMPNIGLNFEHSDRDKKSEKKVILSGGDVLYANIGMENYFKKYSFGINYQVVIKQNLISGELKANNILNLRMAYLIK